MSEEWKAQYNKAGRLLFWGVDAQENPGGTPEARSRLCVCQASFLMTFAMGGIPHAGSQQVGAQYATGDQWRNNSRKNEGMEPNQKRHPCVNMTGD